MRDRDFDPWFRILTWATGVPEEDILVLRILLKRIQKMYLTQGRRRNFRFVYSYLKEAYTICVSKKVSSPYTPKLGVAVGSRSGIPLIIPGRIRERMLSDRRLYITVLTILGIHRIIPWWPDVDLSSIKDAFQGKYRTINLDSLIKAKRKLLRLAGVYSYRFSALKSSMLFPQSAGPNHTKAYLGVFADTIGIIKNPTYMLNLLKWFWLTRSYATLVWFSLQALCAMAFALVIKIGSLMIPVLFWCHEKLTSRRTSLFNRWRNQRGWSLFWEDYPADILDILFLDILIGLFRLLKRLNPADQENQGLLGSSVSKLAVVYNTAGKARVIGITNYWVQVALFPLHKEIFKFLRRLPTDGTFSQLSPIWALPATGRAYHSFDLTAATDRLPRELQVDVLSTFVGEQLATLWGRLVDMPFTYGYSVVKYTVGQPMGAYSSWAMLALTHHFIVQSHYSDDPETDYAILGDDVVVPEHMANYYLNVMESLGVSISLAKSIISKDMVEFAKRVRTVDGEDLSIIGPGLIMAGVRDRWVSALALAESCKKGLQRWTNAPEILKRLPGYKPGDSLFGCLVLFGPRPMILDSQVNVVFPPGKARAISDPANESSYVRTYMADFLIKEESAKYDKVVQNCHRSWNILMLSFKSQLRLCISFSEVIPGSFKLLSLLTSPTTWFVIREVVSQLWFGEHPKERLLRYQGQTNAIISDLLSRREELIWALDSMPTHQKVMSSRRFLQRFMDSFPWMEGLKPKVTIPLKGGSLDRPGAFLEEAFPNLNLPMGRKVQLDTSGAPVRGLYRRVPRQGPKKEGELTPTSQAPQRPRKSSGGKHIFVNL